MSIEVNRGTPVTEGWIASLTYRSHASDAPSGAELEVLLASAQARNRSAGVTGMLLYDEGRFFQALEGPPAALAQIWTSIQRDPRHRGIEVLSQRIVPARLFSEWDMQLFAHGERRQRRVVPSRYGLHALTARAPEVVRLVLAGDGGGLNLLVRELVAAGWLSDALVQHLVEPAARQLGDAFIADECTEIDLTIGLGMLQIAGHAIHGHRTATVRPSPYCIAVVPAPGEPHMLAPSLLSELFINAGWAVEIAFPETAEVLAKLIVALQPDVVDIALSDAMPRQHALTLLRETISTCRSAAFAKPMIVSVGGRAFAEFGATAAMVDADHARISAAGALGSLTKLIQKRPVS